MLYEILFKIGTSTLQPASYWATLIEQSGFMRESFVIP